MAYDHDLYLKNCKKMIDLNQEQVDEHLILFHEATDPKVREELVMEIHGWTRWVKIWKERLADAENKN